MPRKPKITAVPIEIVCPQAGAEEGKTEAEQMDEVINEVNTVVDVEVAQEEPAVAKAKAKRAPRKAKVEEQYVEPEVNVEASFDETIVEVTLPTETTREVKADVKVICNDCGKHMSAKTLKYSHGPNCPSKKTGDKKDAKADEGVGEYKTPLDVIEHEVRKRMDCKRSERAARREEMMSKLMQNAF
jgi:hypothetical protein